MVLLLSKNSRDTHPANFNTFPSFFSWRTFVNWLKLKSLVRSRVVLIIASSKSDGCPLFLWSVTLFSPDLNVENHLSAIFPHQFLIDSPSPSSPSVFDCFYAENFVEIAKWQCCFPSFLEMIEHYMIFETHFCFI